MVELLLAVDISSWWHEITSWFIQSFEFLFRKTLKGLEVDPHELNLQRIRTTKIELMLLSLSAISVVFLLVIRSRALFKTRRLKNMANPEALWDKKLGIADYIPYQNKLSKSKPVISLVNFKGGSTKTTVTANLAAFFESIGARVLLVDFDSQGALTDLVHYKEKDEEKTCTASLLLEGLLPISRFPVIEKLSAPFEKSSIFTAKPELEFSQNSLLLNWTINNKIKSSDGGGAVGFFDRIRSIPAVLKRKIGFFWYGRLDIRFNSLEYLTSKKILDNFDVVLIDTPSHVTPSAVNALCASTHLLIPSAMDSVSEGSLLKSVKTISRLQNKLRLRFNILGIVPVLIPNINSFVNETTEKKILNKLKGSIGEKVLEDEIIYQKADLLKVQGATLRFFEEAKMSISSKRAIYDMFFMLGEAIIEDIYRDDRRRGRVLKEKLDRKLEELVHELPKINSPNNVVMTYKKLQEIIKKAA